MGDLPCHLKRAFLQLELALSRAPVPRAVVNARAQLARLCFAPSRGALLAAQHHEGAVRVEDGEVALEVVDEVEFHLRELGIVGGEGLDAELFV